MLIETRLIMGMPITVRLQDYSATPALMEEVFAFFTEVDERYSPFKTTSDVALLNRGELASDDYNADLRAILALAERTKRESNGYFDIMRDGVCDPSGIVKGWAIQRAAQILRARGMTNFYVDAGGDVQVAGLLDGALWRIGIRNPFNRQQIVKALAVSDCGVATSGTAIRGQHIYNPIDPDAKPSEIVSLTVIAAQILDADRYATAAFAMGRAGIRFIEDSSGFEGYLIDTNGIATYTSGFARYLFRS